MTEVLIKGLRTLLRDYRLPRGRNQRLQGPLFTEDNELLNEIKKRVRSAQGPAVLSGSSLISLMLSLTSVALAL